MENRPSQSKARVIVLIVFVIGFAAGAMSMNLYQRSSAPNGRDPKTPGQHQARLLAKMTDRLMLNGEQQQAVQSILEETNDRYGQVRKDIEPRIDSIRQEGRNRIRQILSAEQLPEFEAMVREQDLQRSKWQERNKK